jgi:hypothetical protein
MPRGIVFDTTFPKFCNHVSLKTFPFYSILERKNIKKSSQVPCSIKIHSFLFSKQYYTHLEAMYAKK